MAQDVEALAKPKLFAPFSTADLFCYVIPGSTTLIAIFAFEMRASHASVLAGKGSDYLHLPLYHAAKIISADDFSKGFVFAAVALVTLLTLSYVTGHLVSSLSSLFLDRVLLSKGHGYPYIYHLRFRRHVRPITYSEAYYRGAWFWLNAALASGIISRFTERSEVLWLAITCATIFGVASILKIGADARCFAARDKKLRRLPRAVQYFILAYSFPYDGPANTFDRLTDARAPLAKEVRTAYWREFSRIYEMNPRWAGSNNYWLPYLYILQKGTPYYPLLVNWLHLYEFARNLATAFYVGSAYAAVVLALQAPWVKQLDHQVLISFPMVYAAAALILMSRYYYLYSCYYTKFIFRAFVHATSQDSTNPPSSQTAMTAATS